MALMRSCAFWVAIVTLLCTCLTQARRYSPEQRGALLAASKPRMDWVDKRGPPLDRRASDSVCAVSYVMPLVPLCVTGVRADPGGNVQTSSQQLVYQAGWSKLVHQLWR